MARDTSTISPRPSSPSMAFTSGDGGVLYRVPREHGLDLLDWLGLDRPEFGAIPVSELAARCRRRLWPMPRNVDPAAPGREAGALRSMTARLLEFCDAVPSPGGPVIFG